MCRGTGREASRRMALSSFTIVPCGFAITIHSGPQNSRDKIHQNCQLPRLGTSWKYNLHTLLFSYTCTARACFLLYICSINAFKAKMFPCLWMKTTIVLEFFCFWEEENISEHFVFVNRDQWRDILENMLS